MLIDYQNNEELAEIIENVVKMAARYGRAGAAEEARPMVEEEEYNKLELCVQMLEARQRVYIKS